MFVVVLKTVHGHYPASGIWPKNLSAVNESSESRSVTGSGPVPLFPAQGHRHTLCSTVGMVNT